MHIIERDETGEVSHVYGYTYSHTWTKRTPVKTDESLGGVSKLRGLMDIFLPAGFPASVTPDYINYQIYDSLQAFSSSIAGLLASRAVLEGIGVGDESATAANAMILTIIQDVISRLATITFAWQLGTALEPEAKMYRLAADIFNDIALVTDCLSPALPAQIRIIALCLSGSLRSLCGVAAGGAKAALSIHFAKSGNIGELNAKDSSQETVIGLLGMLCGSFVVTYVTSRKATWISLIFLLIVHLGTNYLAVRSVVMTTLNRQRTNIVYMHYRKTKKVLDPLEVSRIERIFEWDGAVRDHPSNVLLGRCKIGEPLSTIEGAINRLMSSSALLETLHDQKYMLWPIASTSWLFRTNYDYYIFPQHNASSRDLLKAWIHTIVFADVRRFTGGISTIDETIDETRKIFKEIEKEFPKFCDLLIAAGWSISTSAIITRPLHTISLEEDKKAS